MSTSEEKMFDYSERRFQSLLTPLYTKMNEDKKDFLDKLTKLSDIVERHDPVILKMTDFMDRMEPVIQKYEENEAAKKIGNAWLKAIGKASSLIVAGYIIREGIMKFFK